MSGISGLGATPNYGAGDTTPPNLPTTPVTPSSINTYLTDLLNSVKNAAPGSTGVSGLTSYIGALQKLITETVTVGGKAGQQPSSNAILNAIVILGKNAINNKAAAGSGTVVTNAYADINTVLSDASTAATTLSCTDAQDYFDILGNVYASSNAALYDMSTSDPNGSSAIAHYFYELQGYAAELSSSTSFSTDFANLLDCSMSTLETDSPYPNLNGTPMWTTYQYVFGGGSGYGPTPPGKGPVGRGPLGDTSGTLSALNKAFGNSTPFKTVTQSDVSPYNVITAASDATYQPTTIQAAQMLLKGLYQNGNPYATTLLSDISTIEKDNTTATGLSDLQILLIVASERGSLARDTKGSPFGGDTGLNFFLTTPTIWPTIPQTSAGLTTFTAIMSVIGKVINNNPGFPNNSAIAAVNKLLTGPPKPTTLAQAKLLIEAENTRQDSPINNCGLFDIRGFTKGLFGVPQLTNPTFTPVNKGGAPLVFQLQALLLTMDSTNKNYALLQTLINQLTSLPAGATTNDQYWTVLAWYQMEQPTDETLMGSIETILPLKPMDNQGTIAQPQITTIGDLKFVFNAFSPYYLSIPAYATFITSLTSILSDIGPDTTSIQNNTQFTQLWSDAWYGGGLNAEFGNITSSSTYTGSIDSANGLLQGYISPTNIAAHAPINLQDAIWELSENTDTLSKGLASALEGLVSKSPPVPTADWQNICKFAIQLYSLLNPNTKLPASLSTIVGGLQPTNTPWNYTTLQSVIANYSTIFPSGKVSFISTQNQNALTLLFLDIRGATSIQDLLKNGFSQSILGAKPKPTSGFINSIGAMLGLNTSGSNPLTAIAPFDSTNLSAAWITLANFGVSSNEISTMQTIYKDCQGFTAPQGDELFSFWFSQQELTIPPNFSANMANPAIPTPLTTIAGLKNLLTILSSTDTSSALKQFCGAFLTQINSDLSVADNLTNFVYSSVTNYGYWLKLTSIKVGTSNNFQAAFDAAVYGSSTATIPAPANLGQLEVALEGYGLSSKNPLILAIQDCITAYPAGDSRAMTLFSVWYNEASHNNGFSQLGLSQDQLNFLNGFKSHINSNATLPKATSFTDLKNYFVVMAIAYENSLPGSLTSQMMDKISYLASQSGETWPQLQKDFSNYIYTNVKTYKNWLAVENGNSIIPGITGTFTSDSILNPPSTYAELQVALQASGSKILSQDLTNAINSFVPPSQSSGFALFTNWLSAFKGSGGWTKIPLAIQNIVSGVATQPMPAATSIQELAPLLNFMSTAYDNTSAEYTVYKAFSTAATFLKGATSAPALMQLFVHEFETYNRATIPPDLKTLLGTTFTPPASGVPSGLSGTTATYVLDVCTMFADALPSGVGQTFFSSLSTEVSTYISTSPADSLQEFIDSKMVAGSPLDNAYKALTASKNGPHILSDFSSVVPASTLNLTPPAAGFSLEGLEAGLKADGFPPAFITAVTNAVNTIFSFYGKNTTPAQATFREWLQLFVAGGQSSASLSPEQQSTLNTLMKNAPAAGIPAADNGTTGDIFKLLSTAVTGDESTLLSNLGALLQGNTTGGDFNSALTQNWLSKLVGAYYSTAVQGDSSLRNLINGQLTKLGVQTLPPPRPTPSFSNYTNISQIQAALAQWAAWGNTSPADQKASAAFQTMLYNFALAAGGTSDNWPSIKLNTPGMENLIHFYAISMGLTDFAGFYPAAPPAIKTMSDLSMFAGGLAYMYPSGNERTFLLDIANEAKTSPTTAAFQTWAEDNATALNAGFNALPADAQAAINAAVKSTGVTFPVGPPPWTPTTPTSFASAEATAKAWMEQCTPGSDEYIIADLYLGSVNYIQNRGISWTNTKILMQYWANIFESGQTEIPIPGSSKLIAFSSLPLAFKINFETVTGQLSGQNPPAVKSSSVWNAIKPTLSVLYNNFQPSSEAQEIKAYIEGLSINSTGQWTSSLACPTENQDFVSTMEALTGMTPPPAPKK